MIPLEWRGGKGTDMHAEDGEVIRLLHFEGERESQREIGLYDDGEREKWSAG